MATREAPSTAAAEVRSAEMDLQDRQVLNVIQTAFPMDERPYLAIGKELGLGEDEVIERIRRLRQENVVRQISAIFDTRRLGYKTSLIAFRYPEELLHKGALSINKHPGVSHNYARVGHEYNLWFTLAVPPYESLEETAVPHGGGNARRVVADAADAALLQDRRELRHGERGGQRRRLPPGQTTAGTRWST